SIEWMKTETYDRDYYEWNEETEREEYHFEHVNMWDHLGKKADRLSFGEWRQKGWELSYGEQCDLWREWERVVCRQASDTERSDIVYAIERGVYAAAEERGRELRDKE